MKVTVLGIEYTEVDKFRDEVKNRLQLTGFNVDDFADIVTDMLKENLVFKTWTDVKKEILIREVGYTVEAKMRAMADDLGPKFVKADKMIKEEITNARKSKKPKINVDNAYVDALEDRIFEQEGVIRWTNASYLTYKCRNRQMFQWIAGRRNTDPVLMNCWEAVLYAIVKTGLVNKTYITWCSKPAKDAKVKMAKLGSPSNLAASILANMDYYFWAPGRSCGIADQSKRMLRDEKSERPTFKIPADMVIPRGRILMFGLCEHVAISTGTIEKGGEHGILELDKATDTIQRGTIEKLGGGYREVMVVAPFPICLQAGSQRVVQEDNDKTAVRTEIKSKLKIEYDAKKAECETLKQKKIDEAKKSRDVPGNLQFEREVNEYIEDVKAREEKAYRTECERLDKESEQKFEQLLAEWDNARTKPQLEEFTLNYDANDPHDGQVTFE
jgi:hypothetical protein